MNVVETKTLSVREQAEQEVRKEQAEKAKKAMVALLRRKAEAESVVKGIDAQINDLEQQIVDGTF
jgi:ribosomal protein L31E